VCSGSNWLDKVDLGQSRQAVKEPAAFQEVVGFTSQGNMSDQPEHLNKTAPWRRWYGRQRWRRRARHQLTIEPWCKTCEQHGIAKAAQAADHIEPHRGSYEAFWFGKLQSLCADCHSGPKRFEESRGFKKGCGLDGVPYSAEP
jgi:hypothetical protein